MLTTTGKNVRYAAITATAPQPCRLPGSFGFTQITTIGAIARIGIVWLATMYGRTPRCTIREWASTIPSAKPTTAPSAKPSAASFAVKSALWKRIVAERRLVHLRRLPERLQDRPDVRHRRVESTTNGHVQPVETQT